jgi:hypothetical protein
MSSLAPSVSVEPTPTLTAEFDHYSRWRDGVSAQIAALQRWLHAHTLDDAESTLRLDHVLERLRHDTLNIAFVAEFSRGKSELINALFFSDYRQRVLPASAGRTTMCPTELYYDAARQPSLRLLPINTRAKNGTLADFKQENAEWSETPLNVDSADDMSAALQRLADTIRVNADTAEIFGLYDPNHPHADDMLGDDGLVEIPRWRHALINFPHPLLQQGLVILDTPGLNAIGTEPELTMNLLPNAHAVLFLLAADTGVTQSDIDIWHSHIVPMEGASRGRLVVLNKIDGLWDELKTPPQIDAAIERQVTASAALLDVPASQIFPVSAHKALLAKIRGDDTLLDKSRLPELEAALCNELIPCKQTLVCDAVIATVEDVVSKTIGLLEARLANVQDQAEELHTLRGRNRTSVQQMMDQAAADKLHFARGLQQFNALRTVFIRHVGLLQASIGMPGIQSDLDATQRRMADQTPRQMRQQVEQLFVALNRKLRTANQQIDETRRMMSAMYRKFSDEYGLTAVNPYPHTLDKYQGEINRLTSVFDERIQPAFSLLALKKGSLIARLFQALSNRISEVMVIANHETEVWLKALIAPMETQMQEHERQLTHRLESVARIHAATATLDERILELSADSDATRLQMDELARLNQQIESALQTTTADAA